MRRQTFALFLILAFVISAFAFSQEVKPKNVILFIADGTGHNQLNIASFWKYGAADRLEFQRFPVKLSMTTVMATVPPYDPVRIWQDPNTIKLDPTDSGAAGTAMATGQKTKKRALSVLPNGEKLLTAMEQAEAVGKAVGVVTNSYFYDATPSSFLVHWHDRYEYKEVLRQLLFLSKARVILGAGDPHYNTDGQYEEYKKGLERLGGMQVWLDLLDQATNGGDLAPYGFEPWTLIQRTDDFRALREGETPSRVLGIARITNALNALRSGRDDDITDDAPYEVPRLTNMPTLTDLALGAINVVDDDEDGFFLMIETEGTDEAGHSWQAGRLIEEVLEYETAIAAVADWIEKNSSWDETLLIVTADHETGLLTGPTMAGFWSKIPPVPIGTIAPHHWGTGGHSNLPVPLYAVGAGASELYEIANERDPRFGPILRNDELGRFLLRLFGASVDAVNLEEE